MEAAGPVPGMVAAAPVPGMGAAAPVPGMAAAAPVPEAAAPVPEAAAPVPGMAAAAPDALPAVALSPGAGLCCALLAADISLHLLSWPHCGLTAKMVSSQGGSPTSHMMVYLEQNN